MPDQQARPNWLYETLPYLYVLAGVLSMLALQNTLSILSGLMLISAGLVIAVMRRRHRRMELKQPARSAKIPHTEPNPPDLVHLIWKTEYESGYAPIDTQHRRLFGLSNDLINSVLRHEAKADVQFQLDEILDQIIDHCCHEEALLAKTHHPLCAEHKDIHRALIARLRELSERHLRDELKASEMVGAVVYEIVARHIAREDIRFSVAATRSMVAAK